jgi:hypothetical protein
MKPMLLLFLSLFAFSAQAARLSSAPPRLSYDLGISSGTYDDKGYSEIQLGLNWAVLEHIIWRNSLFTRFGSGLKSTGGLDTSARYVYNTPRDEQGFGLGFFAGPGYRISDTENSGVFGEAGLTLKMAGFATGVGVKAISYNSPGTDSAGRTLPRTDTVTFLILSVGGSL